MVRITFKDLQVQVISNSSGVFSGNNLQIGWTHRAKVNDGQGSVSGDHNALHKSIHIVFSPEGGKKPR